MKSITFIRHGQSQDNITQVMSGQNSTQLSKEGIEELETLKKSINYPEVHQVYSSDLDRAIDTAKILYPHAEVIQLKEFRETNFGPYEGRPVLEIVDEFYDLFLKNEQKGNMETYQMLKVRLSTAVNHLLASMKENESIVVVAHNGVLRMIYHLYKPTRFEQYRDFYMGNGKGFTIRFDNEVEVIELA